MLIVLLVALLRSRTYRQFPAFVAYVASEILQFVVLYPILTLPSVFPPALYAVAYSIGTGLSIGLRLLVLYEVTAYLFRNHELLRRVGGQLFRCMALALLLSALGLAAYTGGMSFHRLLSTLNLLDRTASILQCGLLVGLFSFSSYFGISWRSHAFGIALGLGIFASVELANSSIRTHVGYAYNMYLNYLTMVVYHACVLIWIIYLWAPERSSQYALKTLPEHNLEDWNQELQRLIQRG